MNAWRADPLVWGHGPRIFEVFLEPTCPFSVKVFGKLDDPALDRAARTSGKLTGKSRTDMLQTAAPPRPALSSQTACAFPRWDCINADQRKTAKKRRVVAHPSLLTSPPTRRPPAKAATSRPEP